MADDVTLGTRIRQLRKANGWTLADVAARTGLSVSFLSDIERGRTDPSLNTLDKIAAAHGLRVAITITKDGDTPMADDVTLLPCPFCGSDDVRAKREAVKGTDDLVLSVSCRKCHALVQEWGDKAIALWNTRVSDPRIAALEAQLADARDCIDLFNRMIVRAECTWKAAHPDSAFYPDGADLIVWLKEQVDTLAGRRCETCAHYDGAEHTSICWTHDSHMPPDGFCSYYEPKEAADGNV